MLVLFAPDAASQVSTTAVPLLALSSFLEVTWYVSAARFAGLVGTRVGVANFGAEMTPPVLSVVPVQTAVTARTWKLYWR